jgi:hypothetical protein
MSLITAITGDKVCKKGKERKENDKQGRGADHKMLVMHHGMRAIKRQENKRPIAVCPTMTSKTLHEKTGQVILEVQTSTLIKPSFMQISVHSSYTNTNHLHVKQKELEGGG